MIDILANAENVCSSDHFIHGSESKFCHDFTKIVCQEAEEVHNVIRISSKQFTEIRILCGNSNRTCIQMTLAHHNTSFDHKCCRCYSPFFCAKHRSDGDITACSYLSVCLNNNTASQIILD